MAGHADSGNLTVLEFLGIGGLIGLSAVVAQVVNIAVLIVVIVSKSGVQTCFESLKVHGIGVKHILVLDFCVVPRLGDMYFIGVCLGILTTLALAQDVSGRVVVDVVRKAVIGIVELLYTATTPSGMIL